MCLLLPSYLQDAAAKLISKQAKAKLTKQYLFASQHLSPSLPLYYSHCAQRVILLLRGCYFKAQDT